MTTTPPDGLFPLTQDNAQALFDWVYAPWIKEMGLTDFVVREGFVSMRLPLNDRLKFFSGAVCGQAIMAAIDTSPAWRSRPAPASARVLSISTPTSCAPPPMTMS
jgi:hypothetical protein